MQITNTSERWGAVTQLIHWVTFALVIAQFTMASIAEDLPLGMEKLAWLARHKSVGITIMGIVILRFLWRRASPGPALPSSLGSVERKLAAITHAGLYLVLFLMPLSGWLMSSAKGYPVSWFNLVQLPDLIAKNEQAFKVLQVAHGVFAITLLALALLHIAGALKHQFIYKDNLLKRMLPSLALALVLPVLVYPLPAMAAEWVSEASNSKLSFSFSQAGGINNGNFGVFQVAFSEPDGSATGGSLDVTIDTTSLDTDDQDRDEILRSAELFDTAQFPAARFIAQTIEAAGAEHYLARGTLTIRDVSRSLDLPITVRHATESGTDVVYLDGATSIDRLNYGVGQGEWEATTWVANKVSITWSIKLKPNQ